MEESTKKLLKRLSDEGTLDFRVGIGKDETVPFGSKEYEGEYTISEKEDGNIVMDITLEGENDAINVFWLGGMLNLRPKGT